MNPLHDAKLSWPGLTVAVINHNGIGVLQDSLDALRAADYPDLRVMLIDDASTDGSVAFVRDRYPEVRIVEVPRSRQRPSVGRNLALREADTPYVMLLDNDVALEPDCLQRLVAVMLERPDTFRVVPRIVYHDQPDRIYLDGGGLSYLGISARSTRGRSVHEYPADDPVPSIGSGVMLVDRAAALRLGGWDEDFLFGWGEDAELVIRARMVGFSAWTVPHAIARHVEKEHGTHRAEAQFYNRYRIILTNYSLRGLFLLAPAIALFDLMMFAVGALKGIAPLHLHALQRILHDRHDILRRRRFVQDHRAIGDASLLEGTSILITGVLTKSRMVTAFASFISGFFIAYWQLVRRLLGDEPYRHRPRHRDAISHSIHRADRSHLPADSEQHAASRAA